MLAGPFCRQVGKARSLVKPSRLRATIRPRADVTPRRLAPNRFRRPAWRLMVRLHGLLGAVAEGAAFTLFVDLMDEAVRGQAGVVQSVTGLWQSLVRPSRSWMHHQEPVVWLCPFCNGWRRKSLEAKLGVRRNRALVSTRGRRESEGQGRLHEQSRSFDQARLMSTCNQRPTTYDRGHYKLVVARLW